ncbi:MAG: aspartate aminotransferase family protein [Candidatus Bathyarchaeota archaeon]|nr:aspartate aminotransferase family protein [Candidatus Bathyarchaeota archaeon]
MRLWKTGPQRNIVLVRGEGNHVYDETGKRYLDLQSGYWCNVLGYDNPKIVKPMQEQFKRLTNVMSAFSTNEIKEAMNQLGKVLPPELDRISFLNSGSEAVDLALKIARAATDKTGLVVNERGYYGATAYTFSLCGAGRNTSYLPNPGELYTLPAPTPENCTGWSCLEPLKKLVQEGNDNIAAIIYEPVIGAGIFVPDIGYGEQLRKYADELGALLISNEVTVSPAKSGKWFAHQHDNVVPEILTLGKAIGCGFPVSCMITTGRVEEMCDGKIYHVQSHQNDALSGRAVATVIKTIMEEGLVDRCAEMGEYFLERFNEIKESYDCVVDARGRGLLLALQLGEEYAEQGEVIQWDLIDKGFLMDYHKASNSFRFFPPFTITQKEIDEFIKVLKESLSIHCG